MKIFSVFFSVFLLFSKSLIGQVNTLPINNYYCLGDTVVVCVDSNFVNDDFSYKWQENQDNIWSDITNDGFYGVADSAVLFIYDINAGFNGRKLRCLIDTLGGDLWSDTTGLYIINIYAQIQPGVIGSSQNICYGIVPNSLFFTIPPSGGGSIYTYQWQTSLDSLHYTDIIDSTRSELCLTALTQTHYYRVKVNSNCGVDSTNSVKIHVLPVISKAIITQNQTICYDTEANPLTINQEPTGGNGLFSNQWQISQDGTIWSDIIGEISDTFQTGVLSISNYYRIVSTSQFGCGSIASDSIKITVYPKINSGIINSSQNICYNAAPNSLTFSTLPSGGGESYTYQWQSSLDSIHFVDIIDSTRSSFALTALTQTHYYRVKVRSTYGCSSDTSNIVKIRVYEPFNQGEIRGNDTICYKGTANTIYFSEIPKGGDLSYQYQWLISDDNLNWANIPNYIDSYTPMNLGSSKYYRVKVTSNCGEDYTNSVHIKVWEDITIPTIGQSQFICYDTEANPLTINQEPTGGNGLFSNQWQISQDGIVWSDISGEISDTLQTGVLSISNYYRIVSTSQFGCGSIASDSIKITVYPKINSGIINSSQNICYNAVPNSLTFSTLPSGGGDSYTYQWQSSLDSLDFVNVTESTQSSISPSYLTQTHFYRIKVISALGCSSDTSNVIKIRVYEPFNQGAISGNDTICYNFPADVVQIQDLPSGGDSTYFYQWLSSLDGYSWSEISEQTNSNYFPGILGTSNYYRLKVTSNCGVDSTNSVKIHVWPNISKGTINQGQSICYETEADPIIISEEATGGNSYFGNQWQISQDGIVWSDISGEISDAVQTGILSTSSFYRIVSTSQFGCGSIASDSIKITVYPKINSGIINSSQNVCYNAVPNSLTFSTLPSGGGDSYTYQWQSSLDSLDFVNVTESTQSSISPSYLTQTHFYRIKVISALGCSSDTSNIIKIRVYEPFVSGAVIGNDTICWDQNPNVFKMVTNSTGGDETYTYQWVKATTPSQWNNIDNANDTVLSINNLKESTFYKLVFTSGSNCGRDSSNSIFVLVNPLPDTVVIYGESSVCNNSSNLIYNFTDIHGDYFYSWTSNVINILGGENTNQIVVNAPDYSVFDTLYMTQQINATGCLNVMKFPIWISPNSAPDQTAIIRKSNTNILICADSTAGINYQWGYAMKSDEQDFIISNSNQQYVMLPHSFDTTTYYYWVDTWFVYEDKLTCKTRSFFNNPPISINVEELSINEELYVFPNPAENVFFIKYDSPLMSKNILNIFDIRGRLILKINDYKSGDPIYLNEHFMSGIYLIKIISEYIVSEQKIIVIK